MDQPSAASPPATPAEQEIDTSLGLGRKSFGYGWWALAVWTAAANVNVLARAQNWGFHLPFGPGFEGVDTRYGVAAYGSIGGGALLWIVLAGMLVHGATWGRLAESWPGRVPAAWASLSEQVRGPFPRLLQAAVVFIAILVPLGLQVFFASKFLGGTGTHGSDVRGELSHLWPPPADACSFAFDGNTSFSYCEFYEPWIVVLFAMFSFVFGAAVLSDLPLPRNRVHRSLWQICRWLARRVGLSHGRRPL
jgi:hypothetical protein